MPETKTPTNDETNGDVANVARPLSHATLMSLCCSRCDALD